MPQEKEWTLMFYLASDNPLAPSVVSQLKAIKDAGYHPEANVVAQFDPHTLNAPTHVFDVNHVKKLKRPGKFRIGAGTSPFVGNLILDKLWDDKSVEDKEIRGKLRAEIERARGGRRAGARPSDLELPVLSQELYAPRDGESQLGAFLRFCAEKYPARHYMLFILGHGLVVGNDLFLLDNHPGETAAAAPEGRGKSETPADTLTLKDLAKALEVFKPAAGERSKLELVGFHSCSMSGLEVAYELRGAANYMMASQGPAFVGSWPYRQILTRVFRELKDRSDSAAAAEPDPDDEEFDDERERGGDYVKWLLKKIFHYVYFNSYDFQLAGYPFDLCLCDLNKIGGVTDAVSELASALTAGLEGERGPGGGVPLAREMILLAHWDAQSFWQESYTDLYDFCFRLKRRCQLVAPELSALDDDTLPESEKPRGELADIVQACRKVTGMLERGYEGNDDGIVVRAAFVGAQYQYSHGLSIFFPWSRPVDGFMEKRYKDYAFVTATGWGELLKTYFDLTMRETHTTENALPPEAEVVTTAALEKKVLGLLQSVGTRVFAEAQLGGGKAGSNDATGGGKGGSNDASGGDCDCPSIKNYPPVTEEGEQPASNASAI